ncbi:MAG: hypothetical protein DRO05_07260 [Thermoproteota archaeon]|nr:MAG: hypothetical protein DRO05_07260 [Candidatus Korarchaeota archaeon]
MRHSKAGSAIDLARAAAFERAYSKLNSLGVNITDPDILSLLSEVKRIIEEASEEADPLKAIEGVSRAMNIMRAIDKMSKAIKEHEKVVQESERLREEYRRPGRKSSSEPGLA